MVTTLAHRKTHQVFSFNARVVLGAMVAVIAAAGALFPLHMRTASAEPTLIRLCTWFSAQRGDYFTTTDPIWCGTRTTFHLDYVWRNDLESGAPKWVFNPANPQPAGTVKLYQWYSESRGDNFITSDPRWASSTIGEVRNVYRFIRMEGFVPLNRPAAPSACLDKMHPFPLLSWWSLSRLDNAAGTKVTAPDSTGGYAQYRIEGYAFGATCFSL